MLSSSGHNPSVVSLDRLRARLSRTENLPAFTRVLHQLLLESQKGSFDRLQRMIGSEPAAAAKLLRIANSALYGLRNVDSVMRAAMILGPEGIRSMLLSLWFQQYLVDREHPSSFDSFSFWEHSVAVAAGCRVLGAIRFSRFADELELAGLLHDIGILALERFYPDPLSQAFHLANQRSISLREAEAVVFGFDHADVGGVVAETWGYPAAIVSACRDHHEPRRSVDHFESTAVVHLADAMAFECGFTCGIIGVLTRVDDALAMELGFQNAHLDSARETMVNSVIAQREIFGL